VEKFLRPYQIAKILQIDPRSVYRLINKKQLRAYKISGVYRVKESDFEAFLVHRSTQKYTVVAVSSPTS
jgi:excisionase family DNA binding protein